MTDRIAASSEQLPSADLHRDLLAWFDRHRRDLPWRRRRTVYGTWVSEMMLQQTTVATVVPYWQRFLDRFPDVVSLAEADEADVLAVWSGLGYYRRARQLQAAARIIVREQGGLLPGDLDGWRRLPGVGPYAAGAIASLGLGLPVSAVDANVRRVLSRWRFSTRRTTSLSAREIDEQARSLVPPQRPGDWNEALMELGALVCQPQRPSCDACPVSTHCGAARSGSDWSAAPAAARAEAVAVRALVVAILHRGRLWLEPAGGTALPCRISEPPVREDFTRLHPGLLTLPMTAWYPDEPGDTGEAPNPLALAWRPWPGTGNAAEPCLVGRFRHSITRYRISMGVAVWRMAGIPEDPEYLPPSGRPVGIWVECSVAGQRNVSQLTRKALRFLGDGRG